MTTIQLANLDARLAYLALRYHLARPGSELDPETKQLAPGGLSNVERTLEPQLQQAVATIELTDFQRGRLISAVAGAMNEVKTYPLLEDGRRSTVPGFIDVLRQLFPELAADPDEATQLVPHFMALRRRLESIAPEPALGGTATSSKRRWWRPWGNR